MIQLRIATIHDASLLFEFVNETESLKWKIRTTHPIKWHEHKKWFGSSLKNKNCVIWIIVCDGLDAGQVRLGKSSHSVEVDIYVAPNFRRKNIARHALSHAIKHSQSEWGRMPVTAKVKSHNHASVKLFLGAGFVQKCKVADILSFELPIDN